MVEKKLPMKRKKHVTFTLGHKDLGPTLSTTDPDIDSFFNYNGDIPYLECYSDLAAQQSFDYFALPSLDQLEVITAIKQQCATKLITIGSCKRWQAGFRTQAKIAEICMQRKFGRALFRDFAKYCAEFLFDMKKEFWITKIKYKYFPVFIFATGWCSNTISGYCHPSQHFVEVETCQSKQDVYARFPMHMFVVTAMEHPGIIQDPFADIYTSKFHLRLTYVDDPAHLDGPWPNLYWMYAGLMLNKTKFGIPLKFHGGVSRDDPSAGYLIYPAPLLVYDEDDLI